MIIRKFFICFIVSLISLIPENAYGLKSVYHNYDDLTKLLKSYADKFPSKTYLYSIGESINKRQLWVLAIADTNPNIHVVLRPEVKYIGNMHGNEVAGKENLIRLIDYMLYNQTSDSSIDYLMKNMRIHIMPSMNPDGFEISAEGDCQGLTGRYNAAYYDLNRNFPDLFHGNSDPIQPETKAVINWLDKNDFILSANFHGGSIVVNYPFDSYSNSNQYYGESLTKDDDVFKYLSKNYSFNNPKMRNSECGTFKDGITNGADWYPISGGMQDFNYLKYGCMEVTIELTCCKYPPSSDLNSIWLDNKKSLVEYLKSANTGVKGVVKFANNLPAVNITVKIDQRQPYFKTNKNGEYYRILLPGTYKLSLMFKCTIIYETSIKILSGNNLLVFNIKLSNDLFQTYKNYKLDRYSLFCSKELTTTTKKTTKTTTKATIKLTGKQTSKKSRFIQNLY